MTKAHLHISQITRRQAPPKASALLLAEKRTHPHIRSTVLDTTESLHVRKSHVGFTLQNTDLMTKPISSVYPWASQVHS
uniref:Uncharacterized protein n=1 Tax=Anguilla anguilla TaxID=7936 RepID=A0A0E9Q6Y1_ANGAN